MPELGPFIPPLSFFTLVSKMNLREVDPALAEALAA